MSTQEHISEQLKVLLAEDLKVCIPIGHRICVCCTAAGLIQVI